MSNIFILLMAYNSINKSIKDIKNIQEAVDANFIINELNNYIKDKYPDVWANGELYQEIMNIHKKYYIFNKLPQKNTIIIKRLKFQNIGLYKKECDIDFDKYKNQILGIKGMNSSGKSTIIDILMYGLLDDTAKEGTQRNILTDGEKKGYIEIDLEINKKKYLIKKILRRSGIRPVREILVYEKSGNKIIDLTKSKIEETMKVINNIMNMNLNYAKMTILDSKESNDPFELKKKIFHNYLNTMLNITEIDKTEIDNSLSKFTKTITNNTNMKMLIDDKIEYHQRNNKKISEIYDIIKDNKNKLKKIEVNVEIDVNMEELIKENENLIKKQSLIEKKIVTNFFTYNDAKNMKKFVVKELKTNINDTNGKRILKLNSDISYDDMIEYMANKFHNMDMEDITELGEINSKIKINNELIQKHKYYLAEQSNINIIKDKIQEYQKIIDNHEDYIKKFDEIKDMSIEELKNKSKKLQNEINKNKVKQKAFSIYSEITNRKGITHRLMIKYKSKLSILINEILKLCSNIKISIDIHDDDNGLRQGNKKNKSYEVKLYSSSTPLTKWSNYEYLIINTAFKIACMQISSQTIPDIYLCDDKLYGIDDTNVKKLGKLFEYLKSVFHTVIIITYDPRLMEYVDDNITIVSDKKGSYIK